MATHITGKVITIATDRVGVYMQLDNDPKIGPKDNLFRILQEHSNYNALYSLAIAAFANRWALNVSILGDEEINILNEASVKKLRVDS